MSESEDRKLYELIQQALIPVGHRPKTLDQIDAMLQACAGETMPDEKLQRMLRKVRGEEPVGDRHDPVIAAFEQTLTEQQRELVALHKAEGTEFPPEIKALLEQFRKEIREQQSPPSGDQHGGGL
jgi:hypothetical protein